MKQSAAESASSPSPAKPSEGDAGFLARTFDAIGQAVIATDPDGRVLLWNRSAEALYGWTASEAVGRPITELTPAFLDRAEEIMQRLQDGEDWSGDFEVRRKDGSSFHAYVTDSPILDDDGVLIGIVGVSRDVTERRRVVSELSAERLHLSELFEQAPAFIAVLRGPQHVFELANPRYRQLVGHRNVVGRSLREALPELEDQGYFDAVDRVYRTGVAYVGIEEPIRVRRTPGSEPEEIFVNFVYQPLRDAGETTGIVVLGFEVTDLVHARRDAEQASRAKSAFLATMSHELRTPLNAMLGYTELLLDEIAGGLTTEQHDYLDRIRTSGWLLVRLIEEVLSYSRLDMARESIRPEPVDAAAIVREIVTAVLPIARQKDLRLESEVPLQREEILTDGAKVRQILLNLLGNAVKFTSEGTVRIELFRTDDGGLTVLVTDTGLGIAEGDLERIFEPFTQLEPASTRRHGGAGLGLSVGRRLARLLGGDLVVESEVGAGSRFRLHLPPRPPQDVLKREAS